MGEDNENTGFDPAAVTLAGGRPIVELDDAPDAYDWLATAEFDLGEAQPEEPQEPEETSKSRKTLGVLVSTARAQGLCSGKTTLLATSQPLSGDFFEREVLVADDTHVYGKVFIDEPEFVDIERFDARAREHSIEASERADRWPEMEYLYLYPVKLLESYNETPKRYRVKE